MYSEAVPPLNVLVVRLWRSHFSSSWDQLMALRLEGLSARPPEIPAGVWRKTHRGCRGRERKRRERDGWRQRMLMEKRGWKPCLPSVVMANVTSLPNKAVELTALGSVV